MGTAAISFGLVTVPVRIYPGVRLRQQFVCPKDEEVVPRNETVRGFEIAKDRYVTFTDAELKALDEKASNGIEIKEFVPEDSVDPVYFERTYYLGADKGGEKAYALLADAMKESARAALAQYAARGKDYLVLLRSTGDRLMMQQLYHADEVRAADEVPVPDRTSSPSELKLARQLIDQVSSEAFAPEKYGDEVRKRIEKLIKAKAKGEAIEVTETRPKAEVIDLMEALKRSLGQGGRRAPLRAARGRQEGRESRRTARR